MRVFVIGANGLVGSELRILLRDRGHEVRGGDLPEADVTEPRRLQAWVGGARPAWIVNLAAWTDVDACEGDPARADACNGEGAGNAARVAAARGAKVLHVSTDYVFDGRKTGAGYREEDEVGPLSAYGRSKALGEKRVREAVPEGRWLVVRGQSLYGAGRKSFPDAILRKAYSLREVPHAEIPVVADQTVQPTWSREFADALIRLMEKDAAGVVHFAASGHCTWKECAEAVLAVCPDASARLPERVAVTPTTAAQLGRAAARPAWSVFDTAKYERLTGAKPRPWRTVLAEYAAEHWRERPA